MASHDTDVNDGLEHLERQFDAAMFEIYERAGDEVGYWATRYLQMLRARGGLETARHLLRARATSDGYARLRDAGRLDLTVEACVLRPEFGLLFGAEEVGLARSRLAFYERVMEADARGTAPPDPELMRLLAEAANAPPDRRVDYRDRIAAFGLGAIRAVEAWVADGNSPGFACGVLESIGRSGEPDAAASALRRLRAAHPDWASVIDSAISRLAAAHRPAPRAATRLPAGDVYVATGAPPQALGPCGIRNRDD